MTLSLRQLLFATMTLVSLIPIAIFAIWSSNTALEKEFAAVEEKHLLIAKNLTGALNRYAIDATAAFEAVTEHSSSPELSQLLLRFNIHALSEYDHQGQQIRLHFGEAAFFPNNINHSPALGSDSLKTVISDVQTTNLPTPTLYLMRRSSNQSYWLAAMGTDYIQQVQQAISFGKLGHAAIVDRSGNILAHPKKSWQQNAKNIAAVSVVQEMMRGATGVSRFYSPAVKANMIAGFAAVEHSGWGVMVPQPVGELYSHALRVRYVTIIVALFSLAAALVTSWWLAGRLSRQVSKLVTKADAIARNQEHEEIQPQSGLQAAEVQQLQQAFNQMSSEIAQGRSRLEQRVEERTAELRKAEKLSRHLARHDVVTGLPNRLAIRQTINGLLQRQQPFSLLFIDLDGFKPVNDRYGHAIGDQLLRAVAQRIASGLKSTDVIARYGGDEFLVVLHNTTREEVTQRAASEILARIRQPFVLEQHEIRISACIGAAVSDQTKTDIDQLIHLADTAMYSAKHNGKSAVSLAKPPAAQVTSCAETE